MNSVYHFPLKEKRIKIVNDKVILFKPILTDHHHVMLIVVPILLRRKLLSHYHAGPTGGHMGEYKTLYRVRLRFFWPKLREDIKEWVRNVSTVLHITLGVIVGRNYIFVASDNPFLYYALGLMDTWKHYEGSQRRSSSIKLYE